MYSIEYLWKINYDMEHLTPKKKKIMTWNPFVKWNTMTRIANKKQDTCAQVLHNIFVCYIKAFYKKGFIYACDAFFYL